MVKAERTIRGVHDKSQLAKSAFNAVYAWINTVQIKLLKISNFFMTIVWDFR